MLVVGSTIHIGVRLTLDIPDTITLADGLPAPVKHVSATVAQGALTEILYVVETPTGAWMEVRADGTRHQDAAG